jgi:hypothetical protein
MSTPYLALRALVTGAGLYAAMTAQEAEAALNAATVPSAGASMLMPDEFVDLFTPAEFVAIEGSADAIIRKLVFRLRTRQERLDIAGTSVQGGLAYMAAIGLLTAERAAEIGTVQPGPLVTPAQAMGWPGGYVWASDVIAARAMEG